MEVREGGAQGPRAREGAGRPPRLEDGVPRYRQSGILERKLRHSLQGPGGITGRRLGKPELHRA